MFMTKILDIFMFVSDAFYTISIRLNNMVTLASNQGGAIL